MYEGLAVCRFGDEDNQSRTVKVEGIGMLCIGGMHLSIQF